MNSDLIKQFERECWDHQGNCLDAERFAKMIIAECVEHCRGELLDREVADTFFLTYNDAVMDCVVGLLDHFGIDKK